MIPFDIVKRIETRIAEADKLIAEVNALAAGKVNIDFSNPMNRSADELAAMLAKEA